MNKKLLWHWRCCGFNKAKALTSQTTQSKVCTVYKNSVSIPLNATLGKKSQLHIHLTHSSYFRPVMQTKAVYCSVPCKRKPKYNMCKVIGH